MNDNKPKWFTREVRNWLYYVVMALSGIFIGFTTWDAVTSEQWINLINAVFGVVTGTSAIVASKNISGE